MRIEKKELFVFGLIFLLISFFFFAVYYKCLFDPITNEMTNCFRVPKTGEVVCNNPRGSCFPTLVPYGIVFLIFGLICILGSLKKKK